MTSKKNVATNAAPATESADPVIASKPSRKRLRTSSEAHKKMAMSSPSRTTREKASPNSSQNSPAAKDASDAAHEQPRQTKASVVEALLTREGGASLEALRLLRDSQGPCC